MPGVVPDELPHVAHGTTGEITKTEAWSVLTGLDSLNATTAASRSIHYMLRTTGDGAVTHSLRALTWANLTADGHGSGFSNLCSKTPTPAQCPKLATTNSGGFTQSPLDMANDGTTLLSYLRGDPTHEGSTLGDYGLFRARKHKLGDIVEFTATFGQTVTVTGFCPGVMVTFTLTPGGTVLGTATADGTGKATLTFAAPSTPGTYTITASAPNTCGGGGTTTTNTDFDVKSEAPLPTSGTNSGALVRAAAAVLGVGLVLVGVAMVRRRRTRSA